MKANVLNTNLNGKVAVVTGAGGVLCSYFAKVLARAGARVALLDLNAEAAGQYADEIVKALVENNFDGYVRPDHGRMIWGETGKPGYGLFDRALGATYINGLFEALEKSHNK